MGWMSKAAKAAFYATPAGKKVKKLTRTKRTSFKKGSYDRNKLRYDKHGRILPW